MTKKKKAPDPQNDQGKALSRRDIDLARLEELLAEQNLPMDEYEDDSNIQQVAEVVNPEDIVEISKLPAKKPVKEKNFTKGIDDKLAQASMGKTPKRSSFIGRLLKIFLFFLSLMIIFSLGLFAGRGHILQSGPGHDLIIWAEDSGKKLLNKIKEKPSEKKENSLENNGEAEAEETDGAPVWDWGGGWDLGDDSSENKSDNSDAASSDQSDSASTNPGITEGKTDKTEAGSENQANEEWPTAIEAPPGTSSNYIPPPETDDDNSSFNYEAMLEASEAPDATYSEAAPLPPAELTGNPGLGKFFVQVEEAANEADAKSKVAALTQEGFTAYHNKLKAGNYSVRIGHFATHQDAAAMKIRLEELGYEDPSVLSLSGN